jgi:hypothetical protein
MVEMVKTIYKRLTRMAHHTGNAMGIWQRQFVLASGKTTL